MQEGRSVLDDLIADVKEIFVTIAFCSRRVRAMRTCGALQGKGRTVSGAALAAFMNVRRYGSASLELRRALLEECADALLEILALAGLELRAHFEIELILE